MRAVWLLCCVVACKGAESSDGGIPELIVDSIELDFGMVPAGESATQMVNVSNIGGGSIDVLSVIVSEGDRDVWRVQWDRGVQLGSGQSTVVELSFSPDEAGQTFGAVVHIRTDLDEEPGRFLRALGSSGLSQSDEDGDGVTIAGGDCDDQDALVFPGAVEQCNGVDDDCQGGVPANEADADGDGVRACAGDCDDHDAARTPGAVEICDGIDNDCDGIESDHTDLDGDGLSICAGDCDDNAILAAPGRPEICGTGRDNDCDGAIDSSDVDLDGYDLCGEAPDCDDNDAAAFPRVVSQSGDDAEAGSRQAPLATLQQALDSSNSCPIWLLPGTHLGGTGSDADIRGVGASQDVIIEGPGRVLQLVSGSLQDLTVRAGDVDGPGGGLLVQGGSVVLRDVVFRDNLGTDGAAVAVVDGELALFGDTRFEDNIASGDGGALHLSNSLLLDVGPTAYARNQATHGGAVHSAFTVSVVGSYFDGNVATGDGGAIHILGSGGHLIQGNRFRQNEALNGGAVALAGLESGTVRNNQVQNNLATDGGGIWLEGSIVSVVNNTFTANDAVDGGAVRLVSGASEIHNNIAHFNAGNGAFHTEAAAISASHNTAFATAGVDWVGPWLSGTDNRTENPGLFSFTDDGDPSNDVLILQPSSPSIDSGAPDPVFNDPDGTRNDRGFTGGPGAL